MDESMSNDLISRNGFLKELKRYLNRTFLGEVTSSSEISVGELCSLISKLPTAYDPDAVANKLEGLKKSEIDYSDEEPELTDPDDIYDEGRSQGRMEAYSKSAEIVRNGWRNNEGKSV